MMIALALTLCLTMVIVGIQMELATQLKASKGQRDYDRALQLAEAGANAYLNYLSEGINSSQLTPWGSSSFAPLVNGTIPSTAQVRSAILAGNIPLGTGTCTINGTAYANTVGLVNFPAQASLTTRSAAGSQFGYFVITTSSGATVSLVSYGYSNGIVRRIQVSGTSSDIFDWAAVYGMDPYSSGNTGPGLASNQSPNGTDSGPAWDFGGSTSIVGASGAEGVINNSNNAAWYNGPVILALNGNTLNPTNPTVLQSTPNVPTGYSGTGVLAVPVIRRLTRSLAIEDADIAANRWAAAMFGQTTDVGVEFFKTATYNNNATGIRMLVQATRGVNSGKVRELAPAYPIPTTGGSAYEFTWPSPSALTAAGMTNNEIFLGLRVYPGTYYIQKWTQSTSAVVYLRTTDSAAYVGVDGTGASMPVHNSTFTAITSPNPNSGMSDERNIRFFVGNPTTGNSPNSGFSDNAFMEDPSFASRFRLYFATRGAVSISGTNSNPPKKFRVNILSKSSIAGTGGNAGRTVVYGNVSIASGTYLFGSLIAWQVKVTGSATIEKQAVEGAGGGAGGGVSSTDRLAYLTTGWKELP